MLLGAAFSRRGGVATVCTYSPALRVGLLFAVREGAFLSCSTLLWPLRRLLVPLPKAARCTPQHARDTTDLAGPDQDQGESSGFRVKCCDGPVLERVRDGWVWASTPQQGAVRGRLASPSVRGSRSRGGRARWQATCFAFAGALALLPYVSCAPGPKVRLAATCAVGTACTIG